MFKNRHLQVKVVKDDVNETHLYDQESDETFEEKVNAIGEAIKTTVKKTAFVVVGSVIAYVAADTVRQVAVELAKKD